MTLTPFASAVECRVTPENLIALSYEARFAQILDRDCEDRDDFVVTLAPESLDLVASALDSLGWQVEYVRGEIYRFTRRDKLTREVITQRQASFANLASVR